MSKTPGHTPLAWFTSLAICGAGLIAAAAGHLPSALTSGALGLAAGTLALGAGLLVSTFHLGRKSRAPLVARGIGRSALSLEIVLAVATLAVGLSLLVGYTQAQREPFIRLAAGAIAMLFLVSIGLVYRLGGQRTWRGPAVLLPLTTGLVCGEMFLWTIGDPGFDRDSWAFWIVPIDALMFAARWWALTRPAPADTPRRVDANRLHNLSAARLLIFDVIPLVLLDMNRARLAFVAVAVGLAFDRWLFYRLGDQHTTEAEIARIETIIEHGSRIG